MDFVSVSKKFGGEGYLGDIHTVQDLEADPTGNTIYAEGTLTVIQRNAGEFGAATRVDHAVSNRGYHKENGRIWYTPPFFKPTESAACLHHLFLKLIHMGKNK